MKSCGIGRPHLGRITVLGVLCLLVGAAVLVGCGGSPGDTPGTSASTEPPVSTTTAGTIDPEAFSNVIDNEYMPFKPGTKWVYEGDGGSVRIEVVVTSDTKVIQGVACVVVRDTVSEDGVVTEDTFDWYAQDDEGNVWYFGEDTKEYEGGQVVSTAGSWEAGVSGAVAGIIMKADPQVGDRYQQEYLKGEAEDMAEVLALNETATVPYGSFTRVLRTKEWTPLEPGVEEEKLYAPGIGLIKVEVVKGGSGTEVLLQMITP